VDPSVTPVNDAPTVTPISVTSSEDDALFTNDLLTDASASDEEGDTVTISGTPTVSASGDSTDAGGVTVADSTVTIDPDYYNGLAVGEQVVVVVNYNITDGTDIVANTATYTIDGANDAATITVIATDTDVTEDDGANQTANGTVTVTDIDIGEGTLASSAALYGTVSESAGNWTYTLDNSNATVQALGNGETLIDIITFTSDDGTTATQNITITGTNDAPVAVVDMDTTDRGTVLSVPAGSGVLANDTDAEGDTLTVSDVNGTGGNVGSQITLASGALLTLNANGSYDYNPNGAFDGLGAGVTGTDSFTYTVIDGNGGSDTTTVTIVVTDTNLGPDARDDLHTLDPYEIAVGNVVTAVGTDGGPTGSGVDTVVDNAVVTEFS
jgi:VCBS repeat-containing protein